jgi:hypothetical protein
MNSRICIALLATTVALGGCTTVPVGPSVAVLPGNGIGFDQFRADDMVCRQYAEQSTGQTTRRAATDSAVNSAIVGTAIGAAAGALIGAATGNPGTGAAIGAGGGLIVGSSEGYSSYGQSGSVVQDRYDIAYMQCMYAKGHQVPISGQFGALTQSPPAAQSSPPANIPPPPPGNPPGPPPDLK